MINPPPLRQPCPPGACDCSRDQLLETPGADLRILLLNRSEEKRLLERLENLRDLDDLRHLQQRMQQLTPGARRISLDCGHVPQLACPQALSDALLPALDEIQSKPFMSLRIPLINV